MHTTRVVTAADPRPELIWVGDGGWVACDPLATEHDPNRVLAYVECKVGIVYVLWVRGGGGVDQFVSLREAMEAIAAQMAAQRVDAAGVGAKAASVEAPRAVALA